MTKEEIKSIIKNWNVLFVDDEEFVVETMKEILPILFKDSYYAVNGLDGVSVCKEHKIDLVMTDLSMPKMNGIDMLKKIKEFNQDIKVICVSGHNESDLMQQAKQLGASFIIKPISSAELYDAIEEIL
ncbi:MAG: response regulator [Arcobacteraceae bacterium]|nr:response regulator [Arcobacteraceae bacterium]